jgi:hypothetical protein
MGSAKVNNTPSAETAKWFRLTGVNLGNGDDTYPNVHEAQTV